MDNFTSTPDVSTWSLVPMDNAPANDGSHVTLDARNVDVWSVNNGR